MRYWGLGWAEMETPGEDIPAATHNGELARRLAAQGLTMDDTQAIDGVLADKPEAARHKQMMVAALATLNELEKDLWLPRCDRREYLLGLLERAR